MAPYHVQYTALHENLFVFTCTQNEDEPALPELNQATNSNDELDARRYFRDPEQEIVSEFAVRYGIEPSYTSMTHFSCLATKYMSPGVPQVMTQLLEQIIHFYTSSTFTQVENTATYSFFTFHSDFAFQTFRFFEFWFWKIYEVARTAAQLTQNRPLKLS